MAERNYDPSLDEIIEADDPLQTAEANGLSYRNGSLLLVLELNDEELPDGYGVEVVQEYSSANLTLVEGYVPVESIRSLSNDTAVKYVRLPSQPVTQNTEIDGSNKMNGAAMNDTGDNEVDATDGSSEENISNDSDGEPANGFTAVVALLSVVAVALYARWS